MCKLPSGKAFAQTNALTVVLGRKCGLAPASEDDDAIAQKVVCDAGDLMVEIGGGKPAERINKWLVHINGCLKESGYLGESLSYADFGMYPVLAVIAYQQMARAHQWMPERKRLLG